MAELSWLWVSLVVLRVVSTLSSEVDRRSCSRAELASLRLVGRTFRARMALVRLAAQFATVRVVETRQTFPESWSATQNQSLHRTAASPGASRCALLVERRIVCRRSPPGGGRSLVSLYHRDSFCFGEQPMSPRVPIFPRDAQPTAVESALRSVRSLRLSFFLTAESAEDAERDRHTSQWPVWPPKCGITRRSTEQPPAPARVGAPRLSNVGLSADAHRRAAVGELGRWAAPSVRDMTRFSFWSSMARRRGDPLRSWRSLREASRQGCKGRKGCRVTRLATSLRDGGLRRVGPVLAPGVRGSLTIEPPNHALQATPVGAGLVVLSRRPGVPELGRSAASGV